MEYLNVSIKINMGQVNLKLKMRDEKRSKSAK